MELKGKAYVRCKEEMVKTMADVRCRVSEGEGVLHEALGEGGGEGVVGNSRCRVWEEQRVCDSKSKESVGERVVCPGEGKEH